MKLLFTILFLLVCGCCVQAQIITTIAGNGIKGHTGDGGPATAASLLNVGSVILDKKGNMYLGADDTMRKIDRKGIITSFVGGISAQVLAKDNHQNIYASGSGILYKVDSTGATVVIGGGGSSTADGIPATNAVLGTVCGIAVDGAGNIYLAEQLLVRKISAIGIINTIAGNGSPGTGGDGGPATAAQLYFASHVILDAGGNIYISDQSANCIRKVNTSGIISTIAGNGSPWGGYSGDGGPATAAMLLAPEGLAFDGVSNLYFCDVDNNRVRMINMSSGIITTVAGDGLPGYSGDGRSATAASVRPENITFDCAGNLYISDPVYVTYARHNYVHKITYSYSKGTELVGESNSLSVCQGAPAYSIDTLLRATDAELSKPITWSVWQPPLHGTVGGTPYTLPATTGAMTPSGLTYTPAPGYSGTDSFTIMAGYCSHISDWRTIYVTVLPLPAVAAITGSSVVCTGRTTPLSCATAGGAWSSSASAIATVSASGTVTGVAAGSAVISYTVSASGCSNAAGYPVSVKVCPAGVQAVSGCAGIAIHPNPNTGTFTLLIASSSNEAAQIVMTNMLGCKVKEFTISTNKEQEITTNLSAGVYMLSIITSEGRHVERVVVE